MRHWQRLAADAVLFSALTALALVRLVCQPKLMAAAVRTAAEASALLEALGQQPGVELAEPEHDGWELFHQLLRGGELPAPLRTDAHLPALAIDNGWRLVSFDRGWQAEQSPQSRIKPETRLQQRGVALVPQPPTPG